ncbi:hypothetical protein NE237_027662 [Protea cynaroides]|uniref:FAD dependent oxidoreductase domain-containing protein n=1 Tax=Protea cynaroides TaxID=273540 RepID=A0A9Q0GQX6_9MAGN|nr:hypothetical protein NE237_027662 [Protea cynaroides]
MEINEEVVIVGGGIAGLATALALKKVGIEALVLERSPQFRIAGAAIALFPNALLALQAFDVAHKLTSIHSPLEKRYFTNVSNGAMLVQLLPSSPMHCLPLKLLMRYFTNVANGATQELSFGKINGICNGPITVHESSIGDTSTIRFSSKLTSIQTVPIDDEVSSSTTILALDDGMIVKAKVLM